MAHKVKSAKDIIPEVKLQTLKTKHYTNFDNLRNALFDERKRENGQNEQIMQKTQALAAIRYCLRHAHTHPTSPQIQNTICGWSIFYPDGETASRELTNEQNKYEKEIEILRTQMKLSNERQIEIENALRNYPRWEQRTRDSNWKGLG